MIVADLPLHQLRRQLRDAGVRVRIGPFIARVISSLASVEQNLRTLYRDHLVEPGIHGAHFTLRIDPPPNVRRFVGRQVQFTFEGRSPFLPLPRRMAGPMLEGSLNWCIGNFGHQYVIVHAATLERGGRALLMPAPPGSGKSTLCAALVHRGWRLLSDEFALLEPATGALHPIPRPVALKGASIGLIAAWSADAWLSPAVDNHEGETVAYMRPPAASVKATAERAKPGWVVVPQFEAGAPATVEPMSRARTLMHLADNSFNYNHHGCSGFDCLAVVADVAPAVILRYSRLEEGVEAVDRIATP